MYRFIWSLFFAFILFSCSNTVQKTNEEENPNLSQNIDIIEGVTISKLKVATLEKNQDARGILVSFSATIKSEALNAIQKKGYSGYFVNVSILKDDQVVYKSKNDYLQFYNKEVSYTKGPYLATPRDHDISLSVPYYRLLLPKGEQSLDIAIELLPLKFTNDSSMHEYRAIEFIGDEVLGQHKTTLKVNAPALDKNRLQIESFEISEKVDKKTLRHDFGLLGKGLPDPYWQLTCGEDEIYTSTVKKNTLSYDIAETSAPFSYSPDDVFTIRIYDKDKGPLNTKDALGSISGTIEELKKNHDSQFDKVKNFSFQILPEEAAKSVKKKSRKKH